MSYERLSVFAWGSLGIVDDALDGPFLLPAGGFGLLVSLRGKQCGALFDASEVRWPRDVPPSMWTQDVYVFVRRGEGALSLGLARGSRRGSVARDGFAVAFALAVPLEEPLFRELSAAASAPAAPPDEEMIAALKPTSTLADRVLAMTTFVTRWHGVPSVPVSDEPRQIPFALRALLQLGDSHTFCVQNELLPLDQLVPESGKRVFYIENQGVCLWATDADTKSDDPPVYVRFAGDGYAWERETDRLSDFLLGMLLQEAILAAPFSASHPELDAPTLGKLRKRVGVLPISPWARSGHFFLGGRGVIGFGYSEANDYALWLGAKDSPAFDPLETITEDWPHVGF